MKDKKEKKKCAHEPCGCPALLNMDYCSKGCRLMDEKVRKGDQQLMPCTCGHADCTAETEVSAEVQGLLIASEALSHN